MTDSHIGIALIFSSLIILSCSSSQQVVDTAGPAEEEAPSVYPGWYSTTSEFETTNSTFTAYGMAVGLDSVEATQQVITEAKANFEKNLSSHLESIREDALQELGESSSVASTSFIFALRNAEASLAKVLTVSRESVDTRDGHSSYIGFASVTISKGELASYLEKQLSSHSEAWHSLSSSQAFEEF